MQLIGSLAFSEETYVLVSTSVDGEVIAWDMRAVVSPPQSADGEPYRTVFIDGDDVAVSSAFLASRFRTKQSRVLGAQFTSRNLLLVAAEFSHE